jgi:cell wall assembly regulator SMI1
MATTLERLDTWLRAYRADYHAQLSPGLSVEEVLVFETSLGLDLPAEFKEFFRLYNGQDDDCNDSPSPVLGSVVPGLL